MAVLRKYRIRCQKLERLGNGLSNQQTVKHILARRSLVDQLGKPGLGVIDVDSFHRGTPEKVDQVQSGGYSVAGQPVVGGWR